MIFDSDSRNFYIYKKSQSLIGSEKDVRNFVKRRHIKLEYLGIVARNSLYLDRKCGMNRLRHASQLSVVNGHKCIPKFMNQAPF